MQPNINTKVLKLKVLLTLDNAEKVIHIELLSFENVDVRALLLRSAIDLGASCQNRLADSDVQGSN